MSVDEEGIRKATGKAKAPLKCWGCTSSLRYHVERFQTYRNCENNTIQQWEGTGVPRVSNMEKVRDT